MRISLKRRTVIFIKKKSKLRDLLLSKLEKIISVRWPISETSGDLRRFIAVNWLENLNFTQGYALPEIEIFIPSARKDLILIRQVIEKAIENSANPVRQVSICVPESDIEYFKEAIIHLKGVTIRILAEESMLSIKIIERIRAEFGSRSGWVIAEFLKIEYSTRSQFAGVLVIDSDTIILRNRVWLSTDLKQSLFPVQEYHGEYFELLLGLGLPKSPWKFSFMSHYMLFQPKIYRDMYAQIAQMNPEELLWGILSKRREDSKSPFCVCYEAYALHLSSKFPELVQIEKWSNVGFKRETFSLDFKANLEYLARRKLDSVSLHAYL